jgi:hypothetical protein
MFDRINCYKIIEAHLKSLRSLNNKDSKYIYWGDALLFFIFPCFIALYLISKEITLDKILGDIIKSIAILAAFLFNMLAIIYNSMKDLKNDAESDMLKKIYVGEIHSNLSFNILVGIILIVSMILQMSFPEKLSDFQYHTKQLINFINIFLLILFMLTLLMNLNRVYILLNKQNNGKK